MHANQVLFAAIKAVSNKNYHTDYHAMRKIIHIDADAFYASVEERDNPALRALPIAVGGNPNGRGVVATCNYNARQFGVRSAMASSKALRLCPNLVFVKPRFDVYRDASRGMHAIFSRFTDLIEPLSLDEAYLDVSNTKDHQGSATLIARAIQDAISEELGLSVSAGIAPNKFLAKVASDWRKPAGLFVIEPRHVDAFVKTLPVSKINGVGRVTEKKLNDIGIHTCFDMQNAALEVLFKNFGRYGARLSELAFGHDERPVKNERNRKSLSVEHTFDKDLTTQEQLAEQCATQFKELLSRAEKLKDDEQITARVVKIKFNNFEQTTLEQSIVSGLEDWRSLNQYTLMLTQAWERQSRPVRLVGLGVRISKRKIDEHQLDLFPA